ncbi:MAG: hypothetical protein U5L00_07745 [Desulfovermiculus sp.]|nr:hypothetical protein [Desulfovermiculus sp.]
MQRGCLTGRARAYNKKRGRKGTFWAGRFKSVNEKSPKQRLQLYREFIRQGFELFRDIIQPKRERKPNRIQGWSEWGSGLDFKI